MTEISAERGKLTREVMYLDAGISCPLTNVPFVESRSMMKGLKEWS